MTHRYRLLNRFERSLQRKKNRAPRDARAVIAAVNKIVDDPSRPGLNVHRYKGRPGVWEAYGSRSVRLTFHRDGDLITFRNNCHHDIIDDGDV